MKVLVCGESDSVDVFEQKTGKLQSKYGPFELVLTAGLSPCSNAVRLGNSNFNTSLLPDPTGDIGERNGISVAHFSLPPSEKILHRLNERPDGVDILLATEAGI